MSRGRQKGQVVEQKPKGYIHINEKLRVRVEEDCITLEEKIGQDIWGNYRYYTSWDSLLSSLIRKFTTEKLSKKEIYSFIEFKKELKDSIQEVKGILIGELEREMKSASDEVNGYIKKFVR